MAIHKLFQKINNDFLNLKNKGIFFVTLQENQELRRFLICISFLMGMILNVFGDSHDSLSSPLKISKYKLFYHFQNKEVESSLDSNIFGFQQCNPGKGFQGFYANLGNSGQASRWLEPDVQGSVLFENGSGSYHPYLFCIDSSHYYFLSSPLTQVMYSFGQIKDNFLDVTHSQQINQHWNAALRFRIINSLGAYVRQKSDISNFSIQSQYQTPNKRLNLWVNYIYNKIVDFENGGIASDSLFKENVIPRRDAMPTNFLEAQNELFENVIFAKVNFSLNPINSAEKKVKSQFFPGSLQFELCYDHTLTDFIDNYSSHSGYANSYFNVSQTYEKNAFTQNRQTLSWLGISKLDSVQNWVSLQLGISSIEYSLHQPYLEQSNVLYRSEFNFQSVFFKKLHLDASGQYGLNAYNQGDFLANAGVTYHAGEFLKKPAVISFYGLSKLEEPQFFYQQFIGNHSIWENNFGKTQKTKFGLSLKLLNTKAQIEYFSIKHPVYLNQVILPEQYMGSVKVFQLKITNQLKIKRLEMLTTAVYQNVSNQSVLPLPKYMLNSSLGYTFHLFKVLSLCPGVEGTYVSSYYPEAYSAYFNRFYLQQEMQSTDHVYLDVFVNFKVKRMMLFLKYQHINSGLMGYDYMMVPHYPMQDAALKFGLKWNFFD